MKVTQVFLGLIVVMSAAAGAIAQEPVSNLQDLIGARGGDGEYQLERRGYTFLRTEKTDTDAYGYWKSRHGDCVIVRTTDGRYASIVHAPNFDCREGGGDSGYGDAHERKDPYPTVCGVIANGQTYRYKCRAIDFYEGHHKTKTTIKYPDQTIVLHWEGGNNVKVHFEGMKMMEARYSVYEGETNFNFEGKTYFYTSDKNAAQAEYDHFRD